MSPAGVLLLRTKIKIISIVTGTATLIEARVTFIEAPVTLIEARVTLIEARVTLIEAWVLVGGVLENDFGCGFWDEGPPHGGLLRVPDRAQRAQSGLAVE